MADITAEQVERAIRCVEHATGEPEPLTMNQMADALVGSLVAAGECDPEPAPEVVDVPQPLVIRKRLAGSEHSAAWSSDEPDVVTLYIGGAGEDAPLALLRAMLAAIDAQDRMVAIKGHHARWDAQLAPTRPEPRYKVGDWAADNETGARGIISRAEWSATQAQWRYDMGSVDYPESHLSPALDPALHETARRTVAALRTGCPIPAGYFALPGAPEWRADHSPESDDEWATQLERLLGDA